MRGQDLGTGEERNAREKREESVERREERRLQRASGQPEGDAPDDGAQTKTGGRENEFGVDPELSRLPEAQRDRLVRGSLRDTTRADTTPHGKG